MQGKSGTFCIVYALIGIQKKDIKQKTKASQQWAAEPLDPCVSDPLKDTRSASLVWVSLSNIC